jgi:hypothetical protein
VQWKNFIAQSGLNFLSLQKITHNVKKTVTCLIIKKSLTIGEYSYKKFHNNLIINKLKFGTNEKNYLPHFFMFTTFWFFVMLSKASRKIHYEGHCLGHVLYYTFLSYNYKSNGN